MEKATRAVDGNLGVGGKLTGAVVESTDIDGVTATDCELVGPGSLDVGLDADLGGRVRTSVEGKRRAGK